MKTQFSGQHVYQHLRKTLEYVLAPGLNHMLVFLLVHNLVSGGR